MVADPWVPDTGDLIWLFSTPQAGREQSGRRPALVLSPRPYNERAGLCLVCPLTRQVKGYPFEVVLPEGLSVSGAILADHLRSLDWRARNAELVGAVGLETLNEVRARLQPLLGL